MRVSVGNSDKTCSRSFGKILEIKEERVTSEFRTSKSAPMWVVFLAVGLNYYYDLISAQEYPIGSDLLISLPDNIWSNLPTPDFGIAMTAPFLSTVFSITLISSIESLLSIKAVDKLDPKKRDNIPNKAGNIISIEEEENKIFNDSGIFDKT